MNPRRGGRVFYYAVLASVALHALALSVLALRMNDNSPVEEVAQFIPFELEESQIPVTARVEPPVFDPAIRPSEGVSRPDKEPSKADARARQSGRTDNAHLADNPRNPTQTQGLPGKNIAGGGSPVNLGAPSSASNAVPIASGNTPVGWVPGEGVGKGAGHGAEEGAKTSVGNPVVEQPPVQPPPVVKHDSPSVKNDPEPAPHESRQAEVIKEKLLSGPKPSIPLSVKDAQIDARVTLVWTVDTDGSVKDARVASSSGNPALDQAALDAVRKWKYKPAEQDGKPRQVRKSTVFVFRR